MISPSISMPVDRPTSMAIARYLAERAAAMKLFPGDAGNIERDQLHEVAVYLDTEPPRILQALVAAEQGVAHAWRGTFVEDRIEAWLCAAVAELLRRPALGDDARGVPRIVLPTAQELGVWVDLLGAIGDELLDDEASWPDKGSEAAASRALMVQMMRLWVLGALHIRVTHDAGGKAGDNPDDLPIG